MYAEIFCLLCIALRLCSSKVHILHGLVYTLHNSIWPDFVFGTHRLVTPPATTTPETSYMNVCINEYFCLKLMKKATLFQAFGTTEGARLLYWWSDWFNCKECFDILRFKVDWYAHFSVQKCGLHGLQKRSSLFLVPLWLQYERLTKQCCILLLKKVAVWEYCISAFIGLIKFPLVKKSTNVCFGVLLLLFTFVYCVYLDCSFNLCCCTLSPPFTVIIIKT